jgi:hypothetical protein
MAKKADPNRRGDIDAEVAYWKDEIDTYERMFDKFLRRGRKIMKKYKDVRTPREEAITRYNILWANTQTRLPALYARNPKVVVERRFRDKDPVGRVASEVLERSIQYTLDHCNDSWQTNRQCVLDFELPGRGTVWVRYVPHFKKQELAAADAERRPADSGPAGTVAGGEPDPASLQSSEAPGETAQPLTVGAEGKAPKLDQIGAEGVQVSNVSPDEVAEETIEYEETKLDYVYWEDYGHSWARVDDEVRGKWRRVYMDREELELRFTNLTEAEIAGIPLDWSPKNLTDTKVPQTRKKAIVYEIWDKRRRVILWMVKTYPKLLDKRDDKLGLDGFFPTPRPLLANLCNDDLVPTPNFSFYQDQANEIDELSTRIVSITKALKVAGVRDASAEALDRLLSEGVENALVPVNGWAAMKEKGGLAGSFALLPMQEIADTLQKLRDQRTALIEDVYQLTGISDIVRGMSDPNETATAQQLKGQFSMERIEDAQTEVQRFCRDEIRIIGQIVAGYDIETLKQICGVKLLTAMEKQQIQAQLAAQARMQQMAQAQAAMSSPSPPAGAPPGVHPGAPGAAPPAMLPPHTTSPPQPGPSGPPQGAPGMPQAGLPPAAGAVPAVGAQQAPQPGGQMHPGAPSQPMTPAPGQAPPSPEKMQLLELPTWEEVEALLKNPVLREFRLDLETDSTIRMDEEAEKLARMELIKSVGEFVQQMVQAGAAAPEILPMLGELLMFGIRAFKTARAVEQTFEDMMEALEKAAKQPKGPPPEVAKAQAEGQIQMQLEQLKGKVTLQVAQGEQQAQAQQAQQENQLESQRDQLKAQLDAQTAQHAAEIKAKTDQVIEELRARFEAEKSQWETAAKERIAKLEADTELKIAGMKMAHEKEQNEQGRRHEQSITRMNQSHDEKMGKAAAEKEKKAA